MRTQRRNAIATDQKIDSAPGPDFDNIVKLAASIAGTQTAAISVIDDTRQYSRHAAGCKLGKRRSPFRSVRTRSKPKPC